MPIRDRLKLTHSDNKIMKMIVTLSVKMYLMFLILRKSKKNIYTILFSFFANLNVLLDFYRTIEILILNFTFKLKRNALQKINQPYQKITI